MARGSDTKNIVTNKILENFEGAFIASDGKTIRLPFIEDGEPIQIKVTLTAAKDLEDGGNGVSLKLMTSTPPAGQFGFPEPLNEPIRATEEEKENVKKMLAALTF